MTDWLLLVLIAVVLGVVTEALAARLALWRYHRPRVRPFNILVTFGLIYGSLAFWLADQGVVAQFAAGAMLGLINEAANERWFRAWYFPGQSVPWLRGWTAVVVIGLGWGLVPPLTLALFACLPG
jgi:hypothetical protein